jgi:hypothetical protein
MNIIRFLDSHKIFYTDTGSNVKKGNINVQCPWCGKEDKSEHMGISIKLPHVYGCWRNDKHRGKDITNLIQKLLDCSWLEAKSIVDSDRSLLEKEGCLSKVKSIFSVKKEEITVGITELELLNEFKFISSTSQIYKRFYTYFYSRGYRKEDIDKLKEHYKLLGCFRGDYAWRLIIPIYFQNRLVTWTSRTIRNDDLRYKDLSPDESVIPLKDCLYDFDNLINRTGKKLFITEGPFDCYPLFLHGGNDIGVTCTFTVSVSEEQKFLLSQLSNNYDELLYLPDKGFEVNAIKLKSELSFIKNLKVIKPTKEMIGRLVL